MNTDAGDIRTRRNRKRPRNQNPPNLGFVTINNLNEDKLQDTKRTNFKYQSPRIPKDVSNVMLWNNLPNRELLSNVESGKESNFQAHQFQNQRRRALLPISSMAAQDIFHRRPLLEIPESTLMPGLDRFPPVLSDDPITAPVQKPQSFVFTPGCNSGIGSFLPSAPKESYSQAHQFQNQCRRVLLPIPARAAEDFYHGRLLPKCPESTFISVLDRFPPVLKKSFVPNSASTPALKHTNSTVKMSNEQSRLNGETYLGNNDDDDDEVIYMFTVDTTPTGRIVEQIDLSLDDRDSSFSLPTVDFIQVSKRSGMPNPVMNGPPSTDTSAPKTQRKGKTLKRKSSVMSEEGSVREENAIKRTHQPRCSLCDIHYDALAELNDYMVIADCGHLFCHPCIKEVIKKRECATCLSTVLAVRKLFL